MMLKLSSISTHYGAVQALNGVSLEIKQGEIVTLIGANGAGKTTLMMTICGTPHASSGQILFEDEPAPRPGSSLRAATSSAWTPPRARRSKWLRLQRTPAWR